MRSLTFGVSDEYSVLAPDERVFAFSPYELVVTGTSANQEVMLEFGSGITLKRYTGYNNVAKFPLSAVLQSFFSNTELGDVLPHDTDVYTNASTKVMAIDSLITVSIGTDELDISFDIIWGALQLGEVEPAIEYIYVNSGLPVTFTQTLVGFINILADNSYGKDYDIQAMLSEHAESEEIRIYDTLEGEVQSLLKTYKLIKSDCTDGIYLRWIDIRGEYKYGLFQLAGQDLLSKAGSTFNNYPQNLSPSGNGLFKGKIQQKNKAVGKAFRCGETSADDERTLLGESLLYSLKQWMYLGNSQWIEINIEDMKISRNRMDGGRQIDIVVILPEYYTQSL